MFGLAQLAANMSRNDSWKSLLGSFGDRRDRGRTSSMRLLANPSLDDYTLSTAYRDLWLVRRVVEGLANDALRGGWGVDENEKLENFSRLNTATHEEGAFERALHMSALKGGSLLFIGYKNSGLNPQDLLQPAPVGAEVAFLEVFDRFQLQGSERVRAVDSPEYDRPQVWSVVGNRRPGLRFHASRGIRFPGIPRATTDAGETEQDRDWGYSMLQPIWEDLVRYGVFWQAVGHLMQLSSVGVLKLSGIIEMLASKRKEVAEARIDLLNETLSLTRMLLLDAKMDESYHREAVSFSDMPALLQELQMATAGALGRPVTKLFGRSPAGMNATGESDLRNYYDEVQSYRTRVIEPHLEQVLAITEGREIDVEFESLWQPTEKEKAEVRQLRMNANERAWSMGIWSDAELRKAENEGKLPEKMDFGDTPTAEPTRPVTTIKTVQPGENPAKPEDPKAPDKADPAARARALLGRQDAEDPIGVDKGVSRARDKLSAALVEHQARQAAADAFPDEDESKFARLARLKAERSLDKLSDHIEALEEAHEAHVSEAHHSLLEERLHPKNSALRAIDTDDENVEGRLQALKARKALERAEAEVKEAESDLDEVKQIRASHGLVAKPGGGYEDEVKGADQEAKALQQGPRGGRYYIAASGAKVYSKDSVDDVFHDDADVAAVERRLAARAVSGLLDDPDALGDLAGTDLASAERAIKAHLVSKAKDMLPAKADLPKAKRGRVSEMKKLTTFRAEVEARLPELAQRGLEHYAENERRATNLTDDPDYEQPITDFPTILENQRRRIKGEAVITGPRGGRYYLSVGGLKTYVK